MIHESSYWKEDLLKLAIKLNSRLTQNRWGERNLFSIEKEIFLGFYSVRKLIESRKISDSISKKSYLINIFKYVGNDESIFTYFKEEDYDLHHEHIVNIDLLSLCNQFIHSHHFIPSISNHNNLVGFLFCSDYKRTSHLYYISLTEIIDIFKMIGTNYPSSMIISRSKKIDIKIE